MSESPAERPDASPHLGLPYLLPAQAQKHVTHNEALRLLDVLVQLAVEDRNRTAPPADPAPGQRHLVAAGATGAWSGHDGEIAVWEDGAWSFITPRPGWRVHVLAEARLIQRLASGWDDGSASPLAAASLGINATADTTNRLAVSSPAVLFTHAGAGHQVKVNKAAASDTASLLFQTGWSGRAEMGTAGSDDFAIKVSADGSSWATALSIAGSTGAVALASGVTIGGQLAFHRGNILGSVSQSGGVPTGAVIERGSNSNGDYVRYADGTQICWQRIMTTEGLTDNPHTNLWVSPADITWTFPAAFSVPPAVTITGTRSDRYGGCFLRGAATTTSQAYRNWATVMTSAGVNLPHSRMAIGRWF